MNGLWSRSAQIQYYDRLPSLALWLVGSIAAHMPFGECFERPHLRTRAVPTPLLLLIVTHHLPITHHEGWHAPPAATLEWCPASCLTPCIYFLW